MKTHAKTMRKALSVVLTLAILMSVCAVMLSTLATAYTVDGTATTETKTYVYNFIDDATGASSYSVDNNEYNTNGEFVANKEGLLVTMPETKALNNGGAAVSGGSAFAIKLKDNDVNLGNDSGYLQFEANTDYAISVKLKVIPEEGNTVNLNEIRLAGAVSRNVSSEADLPSSFAVTTLAMYAPSLINSQGSNVSCYMASSSDGWNYLSYDVKGSNAIRRGTDTTGKHFWILMGHNGANAFTNLKILIESVTVTVKDCTTCSPTGDDAGTEFVFVTEKDADGNIVKMNAVIAGETIVPSSQTLEFYDKSTGTVTTGAIAANQKAPYSYDVRSKTQKIEFDMTTADAATAYSTLGHDKLSNVSGQGSSSAITTANGKVSHVDATNDDESLRGLYFSSVNTAISSTYTGYGSLHKAYIKNTRNNLDYYNGYLKVLAGKTYYVDLEYVLVRDGYSTSAEPTISLGITNTASSTFHLFEKHNIDKTNTTTSQHVTAVVDGDGDYNGTAYAGNMIIVNVNNNTTILIKKVTVYVCDKNVQTGDEVFQYFDGEIQKKVVGATLVDPAKLSIAGFDISAKGWVNADGNTVKTVEAKQMSEYTAKRNSTVITFDKGKGYSNVRNAWASGYEFVSDPRTSATGKSFAVTSKAAKQNANFVIGADDNAEFQATPASHYKFENGKSYTISFKYMVKAGYAYKASDDQSREYQLRLGYTTIVDGTTEATAAASSGGDFKNSWSGNDNAKPFVVDETNGTLQDTGYYTLNADSDWVDVSYTITWNSSKGNALMISLWGVGGTTNVYRTLVFDDFVIVPSDDIMSKTNEAVASGIRAEKVDGTKYISAGVRFRARLSDAVVGMTSEIGFVAAPQAYADTDSDWYLMDGETGNASVTDGSVLAAWCKNLDRGVNKVYEDGDGYKDYQVVLTGLTQYGASKNAKGNDIAVVMFYRLAEEHRSAGDDGYRYTFVRSSSYNEVKQMLADAGYGVTGY